MNTDKNEAREGGAKDFVPKTAGGEEGVVEAAVFESLGPAKTPSIGDESKLEKSRQESQNQDMAPMATDGSFPWLTEHGDVREARDMSNLITDGGAGESGGSCEEAKAVSPPSDGDLEPEALRTLVNRSPLENPKASSASSSQISNQLKDTSVGQMPAPQTRLAAATHTAVRSVATTAHRGNDVALPLQSLPLQSLPQKGLRRHAKNDVASTPGVVSIPASSDHSMSTRGTGSTHSTRSTGSATKAGLARGASERQLKKQQRPNLRPQSSGSKAGLRRGAAERIQVAQLEVEVSTIESLPVELNIIDESVQSRNLEDAPGTAYDERLMPPTIGDSNLVVANLVSESQDFTKEDMPQAVEWEDRSRSTSRTSMSAPTIALLALGALVVVMGVVVPLSLSDSSAAGNSGALPPTQAPTTLSNRAKLMSYLPQYSRESALQPNSTQAKAISWMLEDPSFNAFSRDRILQRFALATWFYATGGDSTWRNGTHWLSYSHHECLWQVFFSQGENTVGYVPYDYPHPSTTPCRNMSNLEAEWQYEQLVFWQNGLQGMLPQEISLLTSLKRIQLGINSLSGSLEDTLGLLKTMENITHVELYNNRLEGLLSTEIGLMSNLIEFGCSQNLLSGTIPTAIGALRKLRFFSVDGNLLTGSVPSQLGLLSDLHWLMLGPNLLTSTIPKDLFPLRKLHIMTMYGVSLSGTIPSEIGWSTELIQLYIRDTLLSGSLPSEIGELTNLEMLVVANNELASTIPTSLGRLSTMFDLVLVRGFRGTIPSELGWIPFVGNSSSSSLTAELKRLWNGRPRLALNQNALIGTVPSEIANMNGLEKLYLQDNALTSSLPSQLFELGLVELDVSNTSLVGEAGVLSSTTLQFLDVSNTALSGTLSPEICALGDSVVFDCSSLLCGCYCVCLEGQCGRHGGC
ncbi:Leucine Rich Repeat [Seminavis robusta]|uniref:Leucine Rich Repeat n=1 Tax=Seminavis robusta TaxID=568900 RepID=A0A9N8EA97_9STRA|nr:Leucine Rich Repeat [Seminavis robusta]|eukprot:Sro874_g214250.1 Leucine Rich Repeat (918) ;mRNA; f:29532-32797